MWNWDGSLCIPPAGPEKTGSKVVRGVVLLCAVGMAALVLLQSVWYQWTAQPGGPLRVAAILGCMALLAAGVEVHRPELAADLVRVRRLEMLDEGEEIFR